MEAVPGTLRIVLHSSIFIDWFDYTGASLSSKSNELYPQAS
jgi:hypothetical protein